MALNFGLFESEKGFKVYLIGSNEYEEDYDDWACNEDFIPNEKYFKRNLESEEWKDAVSEIADLLNGFIGSKYYEGSIVENVNYVTCGFDDGELKRIKTPANNAEHP